MGIFARVECGLRGHAWWPDLDEIHGRELYRNVFIPLVCRRCGKRRVA